MLGQAFDQDILHLIVAGDELVEETVADSASTPTPPLSETPVAPASGMERVVTQAAIGPGLACGCYQQIVSGASIQVAIADERIIAVTPSSEHR
jgi:hypothetical protein